MNIPRPREKGVQAAILAYLRLRGAWAERFNRAAIKVDKRWIQANTAVGCSDILSCFRGRLLALEVKRDRKGKATPLQLGFLELVRRAGGVGEVVCGIDDVKGILDRIDAELEGRE